MHKSCKVNIPLYILAYSHLAPKRFVIVLPENGCYANENQHTAQTAKRRILPYVGFRCRYKKYTLSIFVVHRILLVLL